MEFTILATDILVIPENSVTLSFGIIAAFMISVALFGYFYIISVQPAALEQKIGSRAWPLAAYYRKVSGIFLGINMLCYLLYFLYPLPGLPVAFPWNYFVSAILSIFIAIPSFWLLYQSVADAGEEGLTPKKEHQMYGGIYTRIRHPMAVGELPFFWVFAFLLNSPVLFMLSFVWVPIYYLMCIYEEKDLILRFGDSYVEYMKTTCRFFPLRSGAENTNREKKA